MNGINTLTIFSDCRFYKDKHGSYYSKGIYSENFWLKYFLVFDKIRVFSRVTIKSEVDTSYIPIKNKNIEVIEIPYNTKSQLIFNLLFNKKSYLEKINSSNVVIFRLPSFTAYFFLHYVIKKKIKFGVEVVVDPYKAYSKFLFFNYYMSYKLKTAIKHAQAVSYVTKYALQEKYPIPENRYVYSTHYSSIDLDPSFFGKPKKFNDFSVINIVHVANNMNNYIKGHKTAIQTVSELLKYNKNIHLTFIGDGRKRDEFEKYCKKLKIEEKVTFKGYITDKDELREEILKNDIFLFPTKAEGLPRVLIEAMSLGLVCISTPVDGIPELLNSEFLCEPKDFKCFAFKIYSLISDITYMKKISQDNFNKAKEYTMDVLSERRSNLYQFLIKETD